MALLITTDCINCDACESQCPNGAIHPGEDVFVIDADKCTECVGYFDKSPICWDFPSHPPSRGGSLRASAAAPGSGADVSIT